MSLVSSDSFSQTCITVPDLISSDCHHYIFIKSREEWVHILKDIIRDYAKNHNFQDDEHESEVDYNNNHDEVLLNCEDNQSIINNNDNDEDDDSS